MADHRREARRYYRELLESIPRDDPAWFEAAFYLAQSAVNDPLRSPEELREAHDLLLACRDGFAAGDAVAYGYTLDLLGGALLDLPGDPAENVEQAIDHLNQAVEVLEAQNGGVPVADLATVQSRLGEAYRRRVSGHPEQNRRIAARCFDEAARLCPPETDRRRHTSALVSRASLSAHSPLLAEVREGIELTDRALAWDTAESAPLDYATDLLEKSNLQRRAHQLGAEDELPAALRSADEALAVPAVDGQPLLLAALLDAYGAAAVQLPSIPSDTEERLRRAVDLSDSLAREDIAAFSRFRLGRLLARGGKPEDALALFLEAIDRLESRLGTGTTGEESLADVERRSGELYEAAVEQLIALGRPDEALACLERNKARSLGAVLAARDAQPADAVPDELAERYRELSARQRYVSRRIRALRFAREPTQQALEDARRWEPEVDQVIAVADVERLGLERELGELRPQLAAVVEDVRRYDSGFSPGAPPPPLSLAERAELVAAGRAVVELVTTEAATYLFALLPDGGGAATLFEANGAGRAALRELAQREWLEPYSRYRAAAAAGSPDVKTLREAWRAAIESIGAELAELLDFDRVLSRLREADVEELVLVPYQVLHVLPLHLLPADGGYLCDEYAVAYAPSLGTLAHVSTQAERGRGRATVVQNPDGSLAFADLETALAGRHLADPAVLPGPAGRWQAVVEAMEGTEIFHYSGHAFFQLESPLASYLALSDRPLTVADIMASGDLSACSVAALSACETSQVSAFSPADEYVGLPAAMLAAGAASVVGTLWMVPDNAGPLFMEAFYGGFVSEGLSPGEAFRGALERLRTVRAADVLAELDGKDYPGLGRLLVYCRAHADDPEPLFDHPENWGAYVLVGRS